jgi:hypothetical protein
MATCREIIKRAMRRLSVLPSGREPKAAEAEDGLDALQDLYTQLVGAGALGVLTAVEVGADYTAGEWQRITNTSGGAITITLPESIEDDSTETGTRAPYDRAVVQVTGAFPETHIYDAALDAWVQIEALTLDSEAPLSTQLAGGLSAMLAVNIADEYGVQPPTGVALAARSFMATITGRHAEQRPALEATYF